MTYNAAYHKEYRSTKRKTPCSQQCGGLMDSRSEMCRPCLGLLRGRGERNPSYKTGKTVNSNGYIILSGYFTHPNAYKNGTILEHIYVMSESLGRRLRTEEGEMVHHKNGNTADNRVDNLELCQKRRQPPGQRVADLVTWARQLLDEYGEEFPDGVS